MKSCNILASCTALVLFLGPSNSTTILGQIPTPAIRLAGYVTDEAGLLSGPEKQDLTRSLIQFEKTTHHQMVVVTVKSLNGQDVTVFTVNLANAWGIGRRGFNDGIVLLVAPNQRKARISVGYGLEKALPNAWCSNIMQHEMIPRFRSGNFPGGIRAGVSAIIARLTARPGPSPQATSRK